MFGLIHLRLTRGWISGQLSNDLPDPEQPGPVHVFRRPLVALFVALLAFVAPTILSAQTYGPAQIDTYHYEMYRGDMIDIDIGQDADWTEVDNDAVAAILSTGNKLRLVAVKAGRSRVTVENHDKLVWRAEVVVH